MAPDLTSLPQLQSSSPVPITPQPRSMAVAMGSPITRRESSVSPRPSLHSLAAAATMNATEQRSTSSRASPRLDRQSSDRRRSQVAMNLSLNDPALPSPGELTSSDRRSSIPYAHHHRQPSLGDIHNELEQEQEAQVNRMLSLIRSQQNQLDTLRAQQSGTSMASNGTGPNSAAVEDTTPASERSFSFPSVHPAVGSVPRPRNLSRENSNARSPGLRPLPSAEMHSHDFFPPSPADSRTSTSRRNSLRDEGAYYQAEQANLQRENQMLRVRIRELEKQLLEKQGALGSASPNLPAQSSNLATGAVVEGGEAAS